MQLTSGIPGLAAPFYVPAPCLHSCRLVYNLEGFPISSNASSLLPFPFFILTTPYDPSFCDLTLIPPTSSSFSLHQGKLDSDRDLTNISVLHIYYIVYARIHPVNVGTWLVCPRRLDETNPDKIGSRNCRRALVFPHQKVFPRVR